MDNSSRTPIADQSTNRKAGGGVTPEKDGIYLWEGYPRVASAPSQVSLVLVLNKDNNIPEIMIGLKFKLN